MIQTLQGTTQAPNGIQTIQDLYDLINGKTTTTSGGDTTTSGTNSTVTSDSGISQDSMNQMLQSALGSTQGLASVAIGQRTAGGYNSATNKLLVNDLMTRTASQIAQQQQHKVVQTVSAPTTTTVGDKTVAVGGATLGGVAKSAGVLGALQMATGSGSPLTDITNAVKAGAGLFSSSSPATNSTPISSNQDLGVNSLPAMPEANANMSMADQYASYGSGNQSPDPTIVEGANTFTMPDTSTQVTQATQEDTPPPQEDLPAFANGGLVRLGGSGPYYAGGHPMVMMADGGPVTKKGSTVLGSSQFNTVVDPRTGLIGGGTGINQDGVAQGSGIQSSPSSSSTQTVGSNGGATGGVSPVGDSSVVDSTGSGSSGNSGNSGNGDGISRGDVNSLSRIGNALGNLTHNTDLSKAGALGALLSSNAVNDIGGIASRAMTGDTTRSDVQGVSGIANNLGSLTNNLGLRNAGTVGGILSSGSLGEAAARTGDAVLGGGIVSKIKNLGEAVVAGDMQTGINAVASLNPTAALVNAVMGVAGDTSIGKVVTVAAANAKLGDSLDNYLSLRGMVTSTPTDNPSLTPGPDMVGPPAPDSTDSTNSTNSVDTTTPTTGPATTADPNTPTSTPTSDTTAPVIAPPTVDVPTVSSGGHTSVTGTGESTGTGNAGDAGGVGGDSGGTASAADGGDISGPGGPIGDKIHAMLSDGEYVLSADTVKAIGVDKLDALQAQYHTPAATQRLMAFGKRVK